MENKKGVNVVLVLMASVLGTTVIKHFDFNTLSFKMPVLDTIFLLTFILSIYLIAKEYRGRPKE